MTKSTPITSAPPTIAGYRVLSPMEIALVNEGKAVFNAVGRYLDKIQSMSEMDAVSLDGGPPEILIIDQRCVAIARTEAQTASMWAMRAITKPNSFA